MHKNIHKGPASHRRAIASRGGFTLIELLIVIGIISILSSAVIIAVNPARQFKLARDSKRTTDINSILNAIGQNMSENKGLFTCSGTPTAIPTTVTIIKSTPSGFNILPCIVPDFVSSIPYDPNQNAAHYTSPTDYDTQYSIVSDTHSRVTISATGEMDPSTPLTATR